MNLFIKYYVDSIVSMASTIWIKDMKLIKRLRMARVVMDHPTYESLIEDMLMLYVNEHGDRFMNVQEQIAGGGIYGKK
jgi:hypothetical protein